ncbi:MAG: phosphoglycerate kinase [Clostridiales bacterium]|nr:phosphoglycerate kinase [Clostridia bacterium]MCI6268286.1 phosphoglycerate kinase [Clostridiales bacterium]MDY3763850.1 phosphoglycerate kinase [Candidatus Ventricola sp.]MCI6588086.1 phosphoglycerate kinase [Clostridiales bacterium]MCI7703246.1 phosphoglycerate kinase [Clostridiales bacterium]
MAKMTVDDIKVTGKKVLVRCDFNVPMKDGKITNDKRIVAALPTIKKLIADGGKVILCSHLGKPKNGPEAKFSLAPVAERLSEYLGQKVVFADDDTVVGENAKAAVAAMKDGDVVLLQNTRFRKEETKNIETFSKELASLADCYVDDAFGSCHRAHCSTAGVTEYLSPCVAGYLIGKELSIMGKALENADRPFVAILGGAKVADKLNVIENLLEKVDTLIIGGGMAFTFLKAKGLEVGNSLLDETKIEYCQNMLKKAEEKGVKLLLPIDTVCVKAFPDPIDAAVETVVVDCDKIPADMEGCDIGPKSAALFAETVKTAKTVIWNGPMGVFENPTLAAGTLAVAKALAESEAITIIGGGDSAAAVEQMGLGDKMTHISTGGGASLEYLEGKTLPGVACLDEK